MKLGAEPWKTKILIGLLIAAPIVYYVMNSGSAGDATSYRSPGATGPAPVTAPRTQSPVTRPNINRSNSSRERTLQEFRPSLKRKPEERADPMSIDPALKLDLLAKLQGVSVEGTHRSIFDFGQAPPPKPDPAAAKPKSPVPSPLVAEKKDTKDKDKADTPAAKVAPPVPFKFYGYISPVSNPRRRAFFMEGDEIHIVAEGDVVKRRYKIVRIGVNSVVVEDTEFKSQQTLPLEEQPG
jgi:hypothetical protein